MHAVRCRENKEHLLKVNRVMREAIGQRSHSEFCTYTYLSISSFIQKTVSLQLRTSSEWKNTDF